MKARNTWILSPVYSFGPKTDYGVVLVIYVVRETYLPSSSWRLTWRKKTTFLCAHVWKCNHSFNSLLRVSCVCACISTIHFGLIHMLDSWLADTNNATPPPLSFSPIIRSEARNYPVRESQRAERKFLTLVFQHECSLKELSLTPSVCLHTAVNISDGYCALRAFLGESICVLFFLKCHQECFWSIN